MRPFAFERPADLANACRMASGTGQGQIDAPMQFLAGGTTLIDLMKLDVLRPTALIMVPETDNRVNSLGIKAIGEIGIVGMNAAVANAVFNATGKRVRDLPMRTEKLV